MRQADIRTGSEVGKSVQEGCVGVDGRDRTFDVGQNEGFAVINSHDVFFVDKRKAFSAMTLMR